MAETVKQLRRRVRSTKATKQVTRAMEMVSAAKLRRAQGVLMAGRPYAAKLQELLSHLAGSAAVAAHPLFRKREQVSKVLLVIFTADRGLCGGFNANVIRLAEKAVAGEADKKFRLFCIGKKGYDHFRRRGYDIAEHVTGLPGRPDPALAQRVSDTVRDKFLSGEYDEIRFCYSSFVSMAVYRPTMAKFLPLDAADLAGPAGDSHAKKTELDYILEPSPERVFDALLPRYLSSRAYITLAEVMTSEHSARMLAMNNATKNCDELQQSLTLRMNKARQAAITKELIDIVSGAQAVQG